MTLMAYFKQVFFIVIAEGILKTTKSLLTSILYVILLHHYTDFTLITCCVFLHNSFIRVIITFLIFNLLVVCKVVYQRNNFFVCLAFFHNGQRFVCQTSLKNHFVASYRPFVIIIYTYL